MISTLERYDVQRLMVGAPLPLHVWDFDGTLIDTSRRLAKLEAGEISVEEYNQQSIQDPATPLFYQFVGQAYQQVSDKRPKLRTMILTAREQSELPSLIKWLNRQGVGASARYVPVIARPLGMDWVSSHQWKADVLHSLVEEYRHLITELHFIDDTLSVIEAVRAKLQNVTHIPVNITHHKKEPC